MIIIIEGIDRVGKTTLANKLNKELSIPILKLNRINGNDNPSDRTLLLNEGRAIGLVEAFNYTENSIIIDRFHLTEAVYNCFRTYRNDCIWMFLEVLFGNSIEYIKNIESYMHINKYLLVLVKPTDIKISSEKHGKDLSKHNELFNNFYNLSNLNKVTCDYDTLDLAVQEIKRRIENER